MVGATCGAGNVATYLRIELDTRVAIRQEGDLLVVYSRGSYGTAVTTCSAVAPNTWTPSFPRETSVLWLNSHLSHAIGSKLGRNPPNQLQ